MNKEELNAAAMEAFNQAQGGWAVPLDPETAQGMGAATEQALTLEDVLQDALLAAEGGMAKHKKERPPFHVEFAEKVITMLEEGTAPWQKPWHPTENLAPRNPFSGTVYKGVNRLTLAMSGYDDPRWMTLKQAHDAGYRIKQGSRSTAVVYYQFSKEQDKLDVKGEPVLGEDGKPQKEDVALERPVLRIAHVFNAQQVEGFPPLPEHEKGFAWDPREKAEAVLTKSGAVIKHEQYDHTFYALKTDVLHLPPKSSFNQADTYHYATALRELVHWTGAPTRMNREFGPRGSKAYAKEELCAEISSWMVGQDIGVGHDPGQHAVYVKSWVQALREDPLEIMRACRDAEHIRDYVLGLEMQKEKTREQSMERGQDAAGRAAASGAPLLDPAPAKTSLHTVSAENLSPQEEFARKLTDLGLDLKGRLPELDGKLYRVPLLSKNGRGVDGAYCLHGHGIPAGWAQNYVTGEKVKLVATGVVLSPAERERQQQERTARRQAAEKEKAQGLTDFNDLHKGGGLEAVQRQVGKERVKKHGRELCR